MEERLHKVLGLACAGAVSALLGTPVAEARPIVFAHSTTIMAEYREGALSEAQVFYAPERNLSFGVGYLELDPAHVSTPHSTTYARFNFLAKRWNREAAQANIFLWGGIGGAYVGERFVEPPASGEAPSEHDHGEPPAGADLIRIAPVQEFSWNAGGQIDYETRRIYASVKTDLHESTAFTHRADTVQFGFAPYKHDVDSLATWLVVSGRRYSGNMHADSEVALLLRFFRKATWIEAGATTDGKLQFMAMFNF
jgi:hypothetical protein